MTDGNAALIALLKLTERNMETSAHGELPAEPEQAAVRDDYDLGGWGDAP